MDDALPHTVFLVMLSGLLYTKSCSWFYEVGLYMHTSIHRYIHYIYIHVY